MDRYKGKFSDFLLTLKRQIIQEPNFIDIELEFFTIKEKIKLSLN